MDTMERFQYERRMQPSAMPRVADYSTVNPKSFTYTGAVIDVTGNAPTSKPKKMRPSKPTKPTKLGSFFSSAMGKGKGGKATMSPWLYAAGGSLAILGLQKLMGSGKRKNTVYNNYFSGSRMPYTPRW